MTLKRVLIAGGTGMVGGLCLAECLARPDVAVVTSLVRRTSGVVHAKLREIVHGDFLDFAPILAAFEAQDVALYGLGVYTGKAPADEFRRITVDYARAFGAALRARSPGAAFCFLSGAGADPSGRSRLMFARDKGAAENALRSLAFPRVHIFRPGYIHAVVKRKEPNLGYRVMRALWPFVRFVDPNAGVASDMLAHAMTTVGLDGLDEASYPDAVLENRDIRAISAATMARPGRGPIKTPGG